MATAKMAIAILAWQEPEEGMCSIPFPDSDLSDLEDTTAWFKNAAGDDWGETIASIHLTRKKTQIMSEEIDPWNDLACNMRYTTGEGIYKTDCPILKKHGIERS
jgi:hypothetical protein